MACKLLRNFRELSLRRARSFTTSTAKSSIVELKELVIPVPYGNVAAKSWGRDTGYPVLAFHGWLDNCGTFDRLIPLLSKELHVVAVDAPGHGMSSHRPPGCHYRDIDLLIDFKKVADFLGWHKFHIIGHSLGGSLALMFASLFPQKVHKVVVIDIEKPTSCPLQNFPEQTMNAIHHHLDIEKKLAMPPPVYTVEKACERLQKGMFNEITRESAQVLIKRGTRLSECGTGVVFTRDLRCRTVEEFSRLSHEMTKQFMSNVKSDLLMVMATNTNPMYKSNTPEVVEEFVAAYQKSCRKFVVKTVEGNHFVHLNNPERVAPLINEFFSDAS